jgi:hypothetical protein
VDYFVTIADKLPSAASAPLVVAGAGPAGVCAAIAAAEEGAEVLLLERYGFLGGMATAGLVNPFMPYYTGGRLINRGLFARVIERLQAAGGWTTRNDYWARDAFDPETLKHVLQEMVLQAGVRLLLHTFLIGVVTEGRRITRLVVAGKSGPSTLTGDLFVDATGDGDLAAWAGASFEQGRPEDGLCQPLTLNFRMAGVDEALLPPREEISRLYLEACERGEIDNPRENVLWFYTTRQGEIHFNTTRVTGLQGTSSEDLTSGEIKARRQVAQMVSFLQKHVPGFANSYLLATAPQIGVRESRRLLGRHYLTVEEVLAGADFPDAIARGCYPVDIHNPSGTGTTIQPLPEGTSYGIPYRCLLPPTVDNLLVAGRPLSADHGAHSSLRVMPISACVGEAAGVAAAFALAAASAPEDVDPQALRHRLRARGAVIDDPAFEEVESPAG